MDSEAGEDRLQHTLCKLCGSMELMKAAPASLVTDQPGQAVLGRGPKLGWKLQRLRAIDGTTISHAAGLHVYLTYTGHRVGAAATTATRIFLSIINITMTGTDPHMRAKMHHICVRSVWIHTCMHKYKKNEKRKNKFNKKVSVLQVTFVMLTQTQPITRLPFSQELYLFLNPSILLKRYIVVQSHWTIVYFFYLVLFLKQSGINLRKMIRQKTVKNIF